MLRRIVLATLFTFAILPGHATPLWGANESRPPETAPVDLRPGEFVWNAAAALAGPNVVLVSLGEQRAYVYRNGIEIGVTTISTDKGGYETPTGVFVVLQKDKDHHSSRYNNVAMPYTQRLTWSGAALHAGGLPGYPSSHGCVHLPSMFSEELFAVSPMGLTVVVVDEETVPGEVAHPPAFAPVDARSGVPHVPDRLGAGEDFRIEPEKSPHGPVSLLISAADRRALLFRNGIEIGRARVSLRDAAAPPGHFDDAGRALPFDAASGVRLPDGFSRAVYLLLGPGSTMLITDAPILSENTASGFTILSDGPPADTTP